jgi:V/A-type H+-transporting ATPase subunit A
VTQATLKVVGAFHGLSRARSDARKYPSIDPMDSWSKYPGLVDVPMVEFARNVLEKGDEVGQMMKVVGEEGTALEDYILYQKGEFLDAVYLQQNAFDPVDAAVGVERQQHVFDLLFRILGSDLKLDSKEQARTFFYQVRQKFIDYNGAEWESEDFQSLENQIVEMLDEVSNGLSTEAEAVYNKRGSNA